MHIVLLKCPRVQIAFLKFTIEIWSIQWNNTGFLPSCICVGTTVWMYHLDSNEIHGEKAKWNFTRILRAVLNKSWKQHSTEQLYGHLPLIWETLRWVRMNSYDLLLHMDTPVLADHICWLWIQSRRLTRGDRWMARESENHAISTT